MVRRRRREQDPLTRYTLAIKQEELRIAELERRRRDANAKTAAIIDVSITSRRRMLGVYRARLLELETRGETVLQ